MKILNNPPRKTTCRCGVELEYNNNDIKHGGDTFRHEYEDYIICPICNEKIIVKSGSYNAIPYN